MKLIYIKLVNVAGLMVGSNKNTIEIDLSKSKNKIIAICGRNGSGKTVLLSSLTPFAYTSSLDERSTLPYILEKENGYKEVRYQDKDDFYIIKHYYKAIKDSHSVKSYFIKNGEELNENGNVTSFNALVEIHLGLTQEMLRLARIGTNVSSFISLTPSKRKDYIGKLITEIDSYLKIYKKINDDIKVVKVLLSSNHTNLYNCHITDPIIEEEKLSKIKKEMKKEEKERDRIIAKISKIKALISSNNIEELKNKKKEAEVSILEFNRIERSVKELSLEDTSLDDLIKLRSEISNSIIDIQSKINSYRISIDNTSKNIERLETSIKKITSNSDIQSLLDSIHQLRSMIQITNDIVLKFKPIGSTTSDDIRNIIQKLSSFNQIGTMLYTFGKKAIETYLRLRRDRIDIDKFIKEQLKRNTHRINESDLEMLFEKLFQDDFIITPNCDSAFLECPYYRFSELINTWKKDINHESFDDEILRYIKIIANNIDNILNEIDILKRIEIPDALKLILKEETVLQRLENRIQLFPLSDLQEYLSIMKEYEIYQDHKKRLKEYEYQLSIYQKSGIHNHIDEINQLKESIKFYKNNIQTLNSKIDQQKKQLSSIDEQITLVTKYLDGKKYKKIFESTLETTNRILIPLEHASEEQRELEFSLRQITSQVDHLRQEQRILESKIQEYNRLVEEGKKLSTTYEDLNVILKAASTKKGIPVIYMKRYLTKIRNLANNLLKIIYNDKFKLGKFHVTQDTFEVPYIKNGRKIPDVRYASQSEVGLSTVALSFALFNEAAGDYNILLLDEIDSGLDEESRPLFLKMLYKQMIELKAEQVFMISQNLTSMANIPMDCIVLTDVGYKSKLQNIIYNF